MSDRKKLDAWADELLDTGKRNNLISFRDTKSSSADVVFPSSEEIFSKCSVGHIFEVFDPKIPDDEIEGISEVEIVSPEKEERNLSKEDYREQYSPRIKNEKYLLIYGLTPNPITAVKNISKKAQSIQEETGINVAYLAFGFLKWNENEGSDVFFKAPLLLVHIDIETGSILEPTRIEIRDDDVIVNPTFSYRFQTDHGISLPEYVDGESLSSYFSKVSQIVNRLGWEVVNECKLGIFSFLKINMYEDLKKNADIILENEIVRTILGENTQCLESSFDSETDSVVENPLIELHTVVDADSSQIKAIEMAKSGRSFVLQGPPGTGKSQTITNIIAECLHDKKKVLFVSEKQAALNVVFNKLKKVGLDDFCLELHSYKANKKTVIEELNHTLAMKKTEVSQGVQEEIRQKRDAQAKLDSYAAELHKKRDIIEKSLYQLFELYSAQRLFRDVPFQISNIDKLDQNYLIEAIRLLEQYVEFVPSIGRDYHLNNWYGFLNDDIDFEHKTALKNDIVSSLDGYQRLKQTAVHLDRLYGIIINNLSEAKRWQQLLLFIASSDVITPSFLSHDALTYAQPHINAMKESSEIIIPIKENYLENYNQDIICELDGRALYAKLNGQFGSVISRMFNGEYKNLLATIQFYRKDGKRINYHHALELSDKLIKIQSATKSFEENESAIRGWLGKCYKGVYTDWIHVTSELEWLSNNYDRGTISFGTISAMNKEDFFEAQSVFLNESKRLDSTIGELEESKKRVTNQFSLESLNLENDGLDKCIKKLNGCLSEYDKLGNWISFMRLFGQLKEKNLSDFVDLIIEKEITPKDTMGVFLKLFYKQWIEFIIFSVPELNSFTRIKQDQAIQVFKEKDHLQYTISKAQIRSELSQLRPNLDLVAGGSPISILRREGSKKRKQMPIRKLLSETGSLVQTIKPCFLMSPLSVSTFLDPEKIRFDTVIFDEASQIFPQDAIGAIYRGKQLIVVGDMKQMPPSNFFNVSGNNDDDDEETGDVKDFESILDLCSTSFATERLAWHYRSHYEQLIAFSNLHFYNNNLVTFPSSSKDHDGIGVDYYYTNGVFDRGNKTNKAEAQFVVDLVFKNIEKYPNRSLGVVAFSASQQNLIDKLLYKKRELNQSYEWYFKSDMPEPFFVKNLETVQGDERDTIVFSVAYAKDSQGRFINNFGPLNREGGERRLNVAVTRARENVQLVASIHASDIDLSSTESRGAKLLRAYLDYAENGEQALERTVTVSNEDKFDSDFEQEVCDYLRDQGFTVDTQVGCSGYRIDLGLRMPDSSNYLMAIECDGATYHSSKNARDRDILRQRVLESMGWVFYRIWSTDWYRNKTVEKERLVQVAKEAVEKEKKGKGLSEDKTANEVLAVSHNTEEQFSSEIVESTRDFLEYRELNAPLIIIEHMAEDSSSFQRSIREILEEEAPLSEEYLLKRIVDVFEREKVTKVVRETYDEWMIGCESIGIIRRDGFLYLKGTDTFHLRIPGDSREIKYISIEELADGLYTLIRQNIIVSKEGLYKRMTNLLGFNRTGGAIEDRFNEALGYLMNKNLVKEEADHLSIV